MRSSPFLAFAVLFLVLAVFADDREEQWFAAARRGDTQAVSELLRAGVDVNAVTRYGVTALTYASRHGHTAVVKLLLDAGANVNAADRFYHGTPLSAAASEGHAEIVRLLLAHGAQHRDGALENAIYSGSEEIVAAILEAGGLRPQSLRSALRLAESRQNEKIQTLLKTALAQAPPPVVVPEPTLALYEGQYASERGGEYEVQRDGDSLRIGRKGATLVRVEPKDATTFYYFELEFTFQTDEGRPVAMVRRLADEATRFERVASLELPETAVMPETPEPAVSPELAALSNWPQFRGEGARGVAVGQNPPTHWDVPKNVNVSWKTPIPGLAHSCPIVWQDKVFVTTAVRLKGAADVRTGLYGDVDSVEDDSPYAWRVYCLHKQTGEILWEQTAYEGVPRVKRHAKSTHANPTPVTNGKVVVAFFASEGLYCYDLDGKLLWKKNLGMLDSGWFFDADYQWGFASSPIIFNDVVIVQCDVQKDSFIAAYRLSDGEQVWRTPRDEIPTWSTPTVCETSAGPILVTNGTNYARGYNPHTGEELWRLADHSEIAIPTPFYADGLIYVASGYRPIKPIYAIRPTARGDISLQGDATTNEHIAWSRHWGGPYTPTPLVYGDYLYICDNDGILSCYLAKTGKQVYRYRLRKGGAASYSASPVAADGRLYFPSEEGVVVVVRAGPKCEVLAANPLGEECLATPAISDTLFLVRPKNPGIGRAHPPAA